VDRIVVKVTLVSMMRGRTPVDDDGLGRDIAAALPGDDIDDALGLAAFLARKGLPFAPVRIGEFELERRIGRGGFGTVYAAMQPQLDRRVAIKLLHGQRFAGATWMLREAQALAQLNHPNVVQVYQVGEFATGMYIAMEFVDGEPLREWQVGRPWREIVAAYEQAGHGLAAAHARGILHLDFKPSNALMGRDGRVRVADFGLAGGPGIQAVPGAVAVPSPSDRVETRPVGGTSGYASPEQASRRPVDPRSDQFSFCAALYEALHGALPFARPELREMTETVPPSWPSPKELGAPRWIDRVLRRGLADAADERWPSMQALLDALRRPPWYRRPGSLAMIAAALVAMPAFVTATLERDDPCDIAVRELGLEWSADRRAEVERAIADSGTPYREALGATVSDELERWADAWVESARAVCTAAHAPEPTAPELHVQQRECLRRHGDRFASVVAMIVAGDRETIESSDALASELEPPSRCEGEQPRDTGTVVADRREIEVLEQIDRVRLDVAAGRLADGNERAADVLALAEDLDRAAVKAEALLVRGIVRNASGEHEAALGDFDEAAALAIEVGRDDLAAESWRRASHTAGYDLEDLARASRWSRLGAAAVRRLGEPPALLAEQLDLEGTLARFGADLERAESSHRAALVHLGRAVDPDHPRWIDTWLNLAHVLVARGDREEGERLYARALEHAEARLGPDHPEVARVLLSRALVIYEDGTPEEMQRSFDELARADAIVVASKGPHSARLVTIRDVRAQLAFGLGRLDDAIVIAEDAWQLQQEHLSSHHSERGVPLVILAQAELARGDLERAVIWLERVLAERSAVADDEELALIDNNLGWSLCRLGRLPESRAAYERMLDRKSAMRSHAIAGLGRVAQLSGRPYEARAHLENALALARVAVPTAAPDLVAEIEWHLAELRRDMGEPEADIIPLVEHALAFYRESGSDELALERVEALHLEILEPGPLPRTRGNPHRNGPKQEHPWPQSSSRTKTAPPRQ
jgi:tetratricopeptide (TPR) repeat protein/predicted Ser/Thr protein kinase